MAAKLPSEFDSPFEAIEAKRAGVMPPESSRLRPFQEIFPQATLITTQVADWLGSELPFSEDLGVLALDHNPVQFVAEYLFDERIRLQPCTLAQAVEGVTRSYVEDSDELYWEEQKSPNAYAQLDDCDWYAVAWYYEPTLLRLLKREEMVWHDLDTPPHLEP
jgi:hypothetical protein